VKEKTYALGRDFSFFNELVNACDHGKGWIGRGGGHFGYRKSA
jgi:hypothetical protein